VQVEHPILCRYASTFHFHPTLPGMLGSTLIRNQVVQMGEPRQKRSLAPMGMMKGFHHAQLPVEDVMGLIHKRAGHGHLRVCTHRIPAGLWPAPNAVPARHWQVQPWR
jgi:hypothetical protein